MSFEPKVIESCKTIEDLIVLEPDVFHDFRGENFEGWDKKKYDLIFKASARWRATKKEFVTDSWSQSRKGSTRGFHGDTKTWKLIQCVQGSIWFAVIDMRQSSSTYEQLFETTLNERNRRQVLVPAGCVNAHQCLTETCLFSYKNTVEHVPPKNQIHVRLDSIDWPIRGKQNQIRSERDWNSGLSIAHKFKYLNENK